MYLDGKIFNFALFMTFIGQGCLTYFIGFDQAFYIPYMIVLCMGGRLLITKKLWVKDKTFYKSWFLISLLLLIWLVYLFSGVVNGTPLLTMFGIAKNYIFIWFLTFFIGCGLLARTRLEKLAIYALYLSILQLPISLAQRLYFAKLSGSLNWDAIVGTFGGSPYGGGFSGAMTIFQLCAVVLSLDLYRKRGISQRLMLTTVMSFLLTVLLGEVKIVVILVPMAIIFYYRKELTKKPIQILATLLLCFGFISVMNTVYNNMYSDAGLDVHEDESILDKMGYEQDIYWFNPETREVSRLGAVLIWWNENEVKDFSFMFGNGPAASRDSKTLGEGKAAQRYPFILTTNSASVLLWDIGVVGVLLYFILLTSIYRHLILLEKSSRISIFESSLVKAFSLYVAIYSIFIVYNPDLLDTVQVQFSISLILGYVVFLRQHVFE